MIWKPNVTVAAVVERAGRFLLVEEDIENQRVINQPAGHWDEGETLLDAVIRETWEETGLRFTPRALIGVYAWQRPNDVTYLRFAFAGDVEGRDDARPPDPTIVRTLWWSAEEMRDASQRLRGPHVLRAVEDHLGGSHHPLDVIRHLA